MSHYDILMQKDREIEQLRARVADLTEDSQNYHRAMQCLSDMKMQHGLCQPRSRKACTNCNAADILEAMQLAYKGPRIVPQQEQEGEGREELTEKEIDDIIVERGFRNAVGGIYAVHVYDFARAIQQELNRRAPEAGQPCMHDWRHPKELMGAANNWACIKCGKISMQQQKPQAQAEPAEGQEPVAAYRYRFKDPLSGAPIWRMSPVLWNGQEPYETQALYAQPLAQGSKLTPEQVEQAKESLLNKCVERFHQELAQPQRPADDYLWDETLIERDAYHEIADNLCNAIAAHFDRDFGEHSNLNCPWDNALEFIRNQPQRHEVGYAALSILSAAMGHPALEFSDEKTIEDALVEMAAERLKQPQRPAAPDDFRETFCNLLSLARIKYGNLDSDANSIFAAAERLLTAAPAPERPKWERGKYSHDDLLFAIDEATTITDSGHLSISVSTFEDAMMLEEEEQPNGQG